MRKLNEKKHEFTVHFENMYRAEDAKFVSMQNTFEEYIHEIGHVERVFVELLEFIETSSESKVLIKAPDVSTFIKRTFN